jgi:CRP/FNR family transcriptional regulator
MVFAIMLRSQPLVQQGPAFDGGASPPRSKLKCHQCLGRTLNICEPLDESGLLELLGLGTTVRWPRGGVVFRVGDPQGPFFKITRGVVAVSSILHDGRRQILAFRVPGDVVGYLEKDGKYAFQGEALTDVEACSFDRRRFDQLVGRMPHLAAAVAAALSDALKQSGHGMTVVGRLKSTERVANFLAELCALYEQRQLLTTPLILNINRYEIADYLGLTIETVSRSFRKLKSRNIIAGNGHSGIAILDARQLRVIAMEQR